MLMGYKAELFFQFVVVVFLITNHFVTDHIEDILNMKPLHLTFLLKKYKNLTFTTLN